MRKSKIINNRILITVSLIVVLVLGCINISYAADNGSMPDLSRDSSTLAVLTRYTDEESVTPISGMELTIYKVADLSVKNGTAKYTATKDFAKAGIDFNKLTTSSSIDAAEKLFKIVEGGKISGKKAVSEPDGDALFGSVEHGMYLVAQTGATGDAKEYTRLRPYIVMAPQYMAEVGSNTWEYNVVSIPKMEVLSQIVNLTKKVNSDDQTTIGDQTEKFSYDIVAELDHNPDSFAVVDKVPKELEVVDLNMVEVTVNGTKLSKAEKEAILKVNGNTVRVEPTKEQMQKWYPMELKVMFYCKFRDDIQVQEKNIEVINVAGYEVNGEYYEPEGDENEAVVKTEFDKPTTTTTKATVKSDKEPQKGTGTRTGDAFKYLGILIGLMAISALVIIVVLKRRRKADN